MDPRQEKEMLLKRARATAAKAEAERRDFTQAEQNSVSHDLARIKEINTNLTKAAESRTTVDELSRWMKAEDGTARVNQAALDGTAPAAGRTMKAALANFAHTAAEAMTGHTGAKAVNAQGSFTAATPFVTGTKDEVIGPDPTIGILGLVNIDEKAFTDGNQFAFLQEKLRISNAAVVPDGAKKPVSGYELQEVTDKLKFVAHISKPLPARYLEDYGALKSYLESVMGRDLYRVIGDELVTGLGGDDALLGILGVTGVQQTGFTTSLPVTLRKARTTLGLVDESPTAWLMNPADIETIELFTDDQGRFQSLREILGNLPLIPSPALPAGTAVLGDWRLANLVMKSGDGVRLTAMDGTPHYAADGVTIDGSLWEFNEVAIRAEVRVGGLAITRPKAFTVVDLTAV